ncbi:MAG: alpha/beta hydrolase [Deinococcales bacterium]
MTYRIRLGFVFLAIFLLIIFLAPFLVTVTPLEGLANAESLAFENSHFFDYQNQPIHYLQEGENPELALVLLHGFGSNALSWEALLKPLSNYGTVAAFDRPAFGLSTRGLKDSWQSNPYTPESQVAITLAMTSELKAAKTVLVGNSAGGTIALQTALARPEQFAGLILISPAVYASGGPPSWMRPLLFLPQSTHVGPIIARQFAGEAGKGLLEAAWSDPNRISDQIRENYALSQKVANWDKSLWEMIRANEAQKFDPESLKALEIPVLIIAGEQDKIIPLADNEKLAQALTQAKLVRLPDCGHVPQEECPEATLATISTWLAEKAF